MKRGRVFQRTTRGGNDIEEEKEDESAAEKGDSTRFEGVLGNSKSTSSTEQKIAKVKKTRIGEKGHYAP